MYQYIKFSTNLYLYVSKPIRIHLLGEVKNYVYVLDIHYAYDAFSGFMEAVNLERSVLGLVLSFEIHTCKPHYLDCGIYRSFQLWVRCLIWNFSKDDAVITYRSCFGNYKLSIT